MKTVLLVLMTGFMFFASCEDPMEEADLRKEEQLPDDSTDHPTKPTSLYFPPVVSNEWTSISPDSLKWNTPALTELLNYLGSKNTYGFIVLKDGYKIIEHYWNGWNTGTQYPIASAGKSIAALLVGIAQQQGLINVNHPTATYLGAGWSSAPASKESLIKVSHHLSMTTGLNEVEGHCISPSCLKYKADAGTRWAYHNGAYNLLHVMLSKITNRSMNQLTKEWLAQKIGLKNWTWEDFNLRLSTRDMARFGLLILNKGTWDGTAILSDASYFAYMTSPSSQLNPAYGFLWWLNGKNAFMIPETNNVFQGPLTPTAPADMISAMGMGDKKIYVVPSLNLVVVRHGDDTGETTFGPSSFDTELWKRLMPVIGSGN